MLRYTSPQDARRLLPASLTKALTPQRPAQSRLLNIDRLRRMEAAATQQQRLHNLHCRLLRELCKAIEEERDLLTVNYGCHAYDLRELEHRYPHTFMLIFQWRRALKNWRSGRKVDGRRPRKQYKAPVDTLLWRLTHEHA